jgi:hypothetical protein
LLAAVRAAAASGRRAAATSRATVCEEFDATRREKIALKTLAR